MPLVTELVSKDCHQDSNLTMEQCRVKSDLTISDTDKPLVTDQAEVSNDQANNINLKEDPPCLDESDDTIADTDIPLETDQAEVSNDQANNINLKEDPPCLDKSDDTIAGELNIAAKEDPISANTESDEDWDAPSNWDPSYLNVNIDSRVPWIDFLKMKISEGNFCPVDLHQPSIVDKINYYRALHPQPPVEGQFDDLSDSDDDN